MINKHGTRGGEHLFIEFIACSSSPASVARANCGSATPPPPAPNSTALCTHFDGDTCCCFSVPILRFARDPLSSPSLLLLQSGGRSSLLEKKALNTELQNCV